jgi:hypothetical protein
MAAPACADAPMPFDMQQDANKNPRDLHPAGFVFQKLRAAYSSEKL